MLPTLLLLLALLRLPVSHCVANTSTTLCAHPPRWTSPAAEGRDLMRDHRGHVLLLGFVPPLNSNDACEKHLEKLEAIADALDNRVRIVLASAEESPEAPRQLADKFPRLRFEPMAIDDPTRQWFAAEDFDLFIIDRCGRLANEVRHSPAAAGDDSELLTSLRSAIAGDGACGWCQYDAPRGNEPPVPTPQIHPQRIVINLRAHTLGRQADAGAEAGTRAGAGAGATEAPDTTAAVDAAAATEAPDAPHSTQPPARPSHLSSADDGNSPAGPFRAFSQQQQQHQYGGGSYPQEGRTPDEQHKVYWNVNVQRAAHQRGARQQVHRDAGRRQAHRNEAGTAPPAVQPRQAHGGEADAAPPTAQPRQTHRDEAGAAPPAAQPRRGETPPQSPQPPQPPPHYQRDGAGNLWVFENNAWRLDQRASAAPAPTAEAPSASTASPLPRSRDAASKSSPKAPKASAPPPPTYSRDTHADRYQFALGDRSVAQQEQRQRERQRAAVEQQRRAQLAEQLRLDALQTQLRATQPPPPPPLPASASADVEAAPLYPDGGGAVDYYDEAYGDGDGEWSTLAPQPLLQIPGTANPRSDPLLWPTPPATVAAPKNYGFELPCDSYTDEICFQQQTQLKEHEVHGCCKARVLLTDQCLPGKCSNVTTQLCCIQRFLQAKLSCCLDPEQAAPSGAGDSFSRCCHEGFVASEDACCPRAYAVQQWRSVHELCLPNVEVDLSAVRVPSHLPGTTLTTLYDFGQTDKWRFECKYGGHVPQYSYFEPEAAEAAPDGEEEE